jgi:hypothetical protein
MVLGYLIYEAVDVAYTVTTLGYRGVRGIYYWASGQDYPEVVLEREEHEDVVKLKERVEKLEALLKKKIDEEVVHDENTKN